jgi:hypothetical protein
VWDREHFHDKWQKEYQNTYLVHGHTPMQYLKYEFGYEGQPPKTEEDILLRNTWYKEDTNFIPEVIRYADNHKFCVDLCTIVSGRVALLDLDTFETIYFDEDKEGDK